MSFNLRYYFSFSDNKQSNYNSMPGPPSKFVVVFTYYPPKKSASGVSNGLYFLLGHDHLSIDYKNISKDTARDSSFLLFSFDIYLHEKVI